MKLTLKTPNGSFPPGGFPFTDPRTNKVWNGYEGTPAMHAVNIILHRRANSAIYPASEPQWFDKASVIQEILAQKFATHPHLFNGQPDKGPTIKAPAPKVADPGVCPNCQSTAFEVVYCAICSGRRITGFKCSACGHIRKK